MISLKNRACAVLSTVAFCCMFLLQAEAMGRKEMQTRVSELKNAYSLQSHQEGGWFAEIYTAPFQRNDRPTAGCIYFLLDGQNVSHFHQLDCDEMWLYHEGCGLKITSLEEGTVKEYWLGTDIKKKEQPMVVLPAGAIFAAENKDKSAYTLVSCVTTPRFRYEGFRLVPRQEVQNLYPKLPETVLQLAFN